MDNQSERTELKKTIDALNTLYMVVFGASLVIIVLQALHAVEGSGWTVVWAITLGSAVLVRMYRTSLVNKYNESSGGPLA